MPESIDNLPVQKSLIDFSRLPRNTFGLAFEGYSLDKILDDVLLVKYVDESADGTTVYRGGLHVPINADAKAWRIGEVLLAGPTAKYIKVGDMVMFPNNLGVEIGDISVTGFGKLPKGIFLNEQRIFGKVSKAEALSEVISGDAKTTNKLKKK